MTACVLNDIRRTALLPSRLARHRPMPENRFILSDTKTIRYESAGTQRPLPLRQRQEIQELLHEQARFSTGQRQRGPVRECRSGFAASL